MYPAVGYPVEGRQRDSVRTHAQKQGVPKADQSTVAQCQVECRGSDGVDEDARKKGCPEWLLHPLRKKWNRGQACDQQKRHERLRAKNVEFHALLLQRLRAGKRP
ncbi:hypothetical protein D9M69_686290 [compost metagenome]